MHHHHNHHQYEYPCQPGLVTLLGSVIGLGTAAMWSGARLVRQVTEEAMWGSCHPHGHEGRHHGECGHSEQCDAHHYVIDCSPHAHCGCMNRGCC